MGGDWLKGQVESLIDHIDVITPATYTEENRYLPASVSPNNPGPMSFDLNPFAREIVDCCDINSPVREVTVMKGVQITYTTMLESILMYFIGHVKTTPCMYVTADKELAESRVENYFLTMLEHSGMKHLLQSNDAGNSRKTGSTKNMLQWEGGGWLKPIGSLNAAKMRQDTILLMIKDELDGWPVSVGRDGDPDKLTSDRCKGVWERRKIFRGSTPAEMATSKIYPNYKKGDQRKYYVPCKHCEFMQYLSWGFPDEETGIKAHGFIWDFDREGMLINESVRYKCMNCKKDIEEFDKAAMFATENGASWRPTATPKQQNIRSYHLPAYYSPSTLTPWYALVGDFLDSYDPGNQKIIDFEKYKAFVNNVKGRPFQVTGFKLTKEVTNALRRDYYARGTVPNRATRLYCGGPVVFLTCTVDVHKEHLDVSVIGWSRNSRSHLVDYFLIPADNAADENDKCWDALGEHIEGKVYYSDDDGDDDLEYKCAITLIDARWEGTTVMQFCGAYENGVFPILGLPRPDNYRNLIHFQPFTSSTGGVGYKITVDFYKDMLATVLRREWTSDMGEQKSNHFSVPMDATDKELKELTTEYKRKEKDSKGKFRYVWHRPDGVRNELWDLLVYSHAAKDIMARLLCVDTWGDEEVNWGEFWNYYEDQLNEHDNN